MCIAAKARVPEQAPGQELGTWFKSVPGYRFSTSDLAQEGWICTKMGIQWAILTLKEVKNVYFFYKNYYKPPIFALSGHIPPIFYINLLLFFSCREHISPFLSFTSLLYFEKVESKAWFRSITKLWPFWVFDYHVGHSVHFRQHLRAKNIIFESGISAIETHFED